MNPINSNPAAQPLLFPGICAECDDALEAPADEAADRFKLQDGVDSEEILGMPEAAYDLASFAHREEVRALGPAPMLERAKRFGAVRDCDPVWLSFSPLGMHCLEFQKMARDPQIRAYLDRCKPLNIASYGGGLHDELEFMRYRNPAIGRTPIDDSFKQRMGDFLKTVLGPAGKCSHEPRELLLLFLSGDRMGELEVFDNQPELGLELKRPTLPMFHLFELYYRRPEVARRVIEYYMNLAGGREIRIGSAEVPPLGEIKYLDFSLTPREMGKIRHRRVDIATDQLADRSRFNLSVWLESQYFFEEPLRWKVLSKIVRAMQPGSYLITNPIRQGNQKRVTREHLESFSGMFGLSLVALTENHVGTKGSSAIYRKVSEQDTPVVGRLASRP